MSIIDKVCGKMGLMDPEDNIDFEEEELSRKAEPKQESVFSFSFEFNRLTV